MRYAESRGSQDHQFGTRIAWQFTTDSAYNYSESVSASHKCLMSIAYINRIVRCCRSSQAGEACKVNDIVESNVPALGRHERLYWAFYKGATMLRKFVCASVIVVLGLGVAMAEDFQARITKVDNGKVTFTKGKKGEVSEPMTLPVAADVKVTKGGKFNKDTKKVEDAETVAEGVKSTLFTNAGEKGVRARISTDADNKHITAIYIMGGKKKSNQ